MLVRSFPFFLTCFGSPNREWLWMFMNGWYWHFIRYLPSLVASTPLQRIAAVKIYVLDGQSLIISAEIVFFFALAMCDNTPVVLYSTSPHMVSLAQRRSPKVKPGTFDPAPGTVVLEGNEHWHGKLMGTSRDRKIKGNREEMMGLTCSFFLVVLMGKSCEDLVKSSN